MTLSTAIDTNSAKVKRPQPAGSASTGKVGVMLVNLGTPDGTDFKPMWRYLQGIPVRPARHRTQPGDLVPDPVRPRAHHAAEEVRLQLRQDLEPAKEQVATAHLHPRAG